MIYGAHSDYSGEHVDSWFSLHKSDRCLNHPGLSRMATGAKVPLPDAGCLDKYLQMNCECFAGSDDPSERHLSCVHLT